MQYTKRSFLGIFLLLCVGLLALGAWQSFFIMLLNPGVSDIWQPMPWFSVLVITYFLGTAVWTRKIFYIASALLIFLPGLLFVRAWEYIIAIGLSSMFVWVGTLQITHEFQERVHFHFFKSMRAGIFFLFLALALSFSSGYYVFLKNASWEELVPRFRIGEEITHIIFKVAGVVNPSFATLMEGDVTVDEFLMNLETQQRGTSLGVAPEQETLDVFLQSGREQIAELVGRSVEGNEKVSTVLSLALQQRLVMLLNGEKALVHMPSQAIPFFLSLLLFFTLLPILSILGIVWVLVAQLIFFCFLRLGWLALDTVTIQQEKLAK